MKKTTFEMMKEVQWWQGITKKRIDISSTKAPIEQGKKIYACVLEDGEVHIWKGKGLTHTFNNIEEVKPYATCIKKVENKTQAVIDAHDRVFS